MKIVIEHCRRAPKWESLQQVLKEALGDEDGHFTKIDRVDDHIDHGATGAYKLMWANDHNEQTLLPITLICVAVGHRQEEYEEETTATT